MNPTITEMTNDVLARDDSPLDIFGHPPRGQLPIWLSAEAAELLEWACQLQNVEPRYAGDRLARKNGEFTTQDYVDWKDPNAEHGTSPWRETFDRVRAELWTHDLLSDAGWFRWRPNAKGRTLVTLLGPPCDTRRSF